MTLKRIKYYIIIITVLFSVAKVASASLEITEIMYDPEGTDTNREWVKLYNDGNDPVTIVSGRAASAWRFSDDIEAKELHLINDTITLNPGEYGILASDKATYISEYPTFTGPVADTSMSLSNVSGVVKIWDGTDPRNLIASKEYTASDSPNDNTNNDTTNTSTTSSSTSNSNSSSDKVETPIVLKTTAKIISPKVVVAGIPFSISSQTTTNKGETFNVGKFVWNFGDGMANKVGNSEQFEYVYQYPGEYVLTLSYFDNSFSKIPTATDRITIKVIPSDVYISAVGDGSDPYIEIGNKSTYEVLLSNWVVTAGSHYFTIPEGTTLLPGKKIKLAPKITGFVGEDLNFITISNPSGETIATYPIQAKKVVPNRVLSTSSSATYSNSIPLDNPQDVPLPEDSQVINLNDLGSSAESSGISTPNSAAYPFVGLGVVVTIGIMSFLLIRKKKEVKDYVEVGLSAKDMTIIE